MAVGKSNATKTLCVTLCILMMASSALSELVLVGQAEVRMPTECTWKDCIKKCLEMNRNPISLTRGECESRYMCYCKYYVAQPPPPPQRPTSRPTLE
ncbi:unnamed protein product [Urochloa decumbens]|uniref:Uncharacterized protein n=1 Tax=Urochloa decumbens TaxID=240449 RepID=A0ABC9AQS8_9POAL